MPKQSVASHGKLNHHRKNFSMDQGVKKTVKFPLNQTSAALNSDQEEQEYIFPEPCEDEIEQRNESSGNLPENSL